MARIYRPVIVRYVDGQTGRRVKKGTPGARKRQIRSRTYRGEYRDSEGILRTVRLSTNKEAARQLLAEKVRKSELKRSGLIDPFEAHHKRPISEHVADFESSLRNKGCAADHVQPVVARVRRILDGCGIRFIGDFSASRVQSFITDLKRPNLEAKRPGLSQQTVNHYLRAIKQFAAWLVRDRRTNDNRLQHLEGGNVKLDIRRKRRETSDIEIAWVLKTAQAGPVRYGLSGLQRATLYATALGTGLRASELRSLTPSHFDLVVNPPTVRIDAANEKARRGEVLPLPADLVAMLRPWLAEIAPDAPLWPGPWAKYKSASRFLQDDLKAARKAWIDSSATDAEKADRERTDVLKYRNESGEQADFHALRHTYLSRLGRSGASPKAMQRLARHSTVELTLGRYTHAGLYDLASAVNGLPPLPIVVANNASEPAELKATGTDGRAVVAGMVAGPIDPEGNSVRPIETGRPSEEGSRPGKMRGHKPKPMQALETDRDSMRRDEKAERVGFDFGRVPSLGCQRSCDRNPKEVSEIRLVILDHP